MKNPKIVSAIFIVLGLGLFIGCSNNSSPTAPPTATPVPFTATWTACTSCTPTPTATNSPTATATYTPTLTFTPTQTYSPTITPTSTASPTVTHTTTNSPTPTVTNSPTITLTPTITWTPTVTSTFTACGAPLNVGTTGSNGALGDNSSVFFSDYTAPAGTLSSVWVELRSLAAGTTVQVAVYTTDGSGLPQNLVAASALQSISTPASLTWVAFNVPVTYLTAGNYSLLMWRASGSINSGDMSGSTNFGLAGISGGDLANPPSTPNLTSNPFSLSIYMQMCPDITPTVTSSPTPSFTPTLTVTPTVTYTPCTAPVSFGQFGLGSGAVYHFVDPTAVYFTSKPANTSGTLRRLWFNLGGTPTYPEFVQVALYDTDVNSYPQNLVSCLPYFAPVTTDGWIGFDMPAAPVTAGNVYALCLYWTGNCCGVALNYRMNEFATNAFGLAYVNGDLTQTPTGAAFYNGDLAAYAEVCP